MHRKYIGGEQISVGSRVFNDGTARSVAQWDSAKDELLKLGYLKEINESMFKVTEAGYKFGEKSMA